MSQPKPTEPETSSVTINIGGRQAWVYQRMIKGVRGGSYYVKGTLPGGGEFFRSTGFTAKGMALDMARKLWTAALEGRGDVLASTKMRRAKTIQPREMRQRIGGVIQAMMNDLPTNDEDALRALEGALILPQKLRKYAGCASVLRNPKEPAIYLLVKDARVIYVGQSRRLLSRLQWHAARRDFDTVYTFTVPAHELNQVERSLIAAFPDCTNRDSGITAISSGIIDGV